MKFLKVSILVLVATVAFTSCKKVEKILPKKDGMWNTTASHLWVEIDDSVWIDMDVADSLLGSSHFIDDGTMHSYDNDGTVIDTATWEADNETITINAATPADSMVLNITEFTKSTMSTSWSNTDTTGGVTTKTISTGSMERAE